VVGRVNAGPRLHVIRATLVCKPETPLVSRRKS
jgi:hypothetical protein